jgi:glutathione synthase
MHLNIAIQMDPVAGINPHTDSTLVLGIEACIRGYEVYYYTPDHLSHHNGNITARAHPVTFHANTEKYYTLGEPLTLDLRSMDVVLLRQDPPFNMAYLTTTYILELLAPDVLVVNDPASVRNHPEKLFPLQFQHFMPPTLVSADIDEIESFKKHHKDIIIKPLYGHGGRSVLRLKAEDDNLATLLEMQYMASAEPLMVQPFLPEVKTQDRRIILIDGAVGGVMGRIPAEHEIRANFRVGGSPAKAELTKKQREICEVLGPILKAKGLLFVGLDVIGDYLTEINVTSPTGLVQMNALNNTTLEATIWDAIETNIHKQ